jgi:spermidine/putrescine transport system substrate-binding protein
MRKLNVIGAGLTTLGFDFLSTDKEELLAARDFVLMQKPLLQAYISGPVRELLASEDVWIAQLWSGDVFFVRDELNENIEYFIPREGGEIWVDSMVIPKGAPHYATAHLWINYIQRPQVQADITNYVWYATPNQAAIDQGLIDEELLNDPNVFPTPEVEARLQFLIPFTGEALEIRDDIWDELKA